MLHQKRKKKIAFFKYLIKIIKIVPKYVIRFKETNNNLKFYHYNFIFSLFFIVN